MFLTKNNWLRYFLFPKGNFSNLINITFIGFLLGMALITNRFLKINLPFFSIRFDHLWIIIVPLIYGFGIGLTFGIITDLLSLLINGLIGFYMWQGLMTIVFIVLIVCILRMVFYFKDSKHFTKFIVIFNNVTILLVASLMIGLIIWFGIGLTVEKKNVKNGTSSFISASFDEALIWIGVSFTILVTLVTLFFSNWHIRNKRKKN